MKSVCFYKINHDHKLKWRHTQGTRINVSLIIREPKEKHSWLRCHLIPDFYNLVVLFIYFFSGFYRLPPKTVEIYSSQWVTTQSSVQLSGIFIHLANSSNFWKNESFTILRLFYSANKTLKIVWKTPLVVTFFFFRSVYTLEHPNQPKVFERKFWEGKIKLKHHMKNVKRHK